MKSSSSQSSKRSPLVVIFLTVFLDLVGFGIIIPLTPYLARQFSASAFEIGLLLAIYSIAQFLFSPVWGALSDRIGRRPVIIVSLLGSALSYLALAFAPNFWVLLISRGFAGMFGGNISTAQAYIADVTKPEERSKGMGMIGAAFGLGFIFGPLIGAGLGELGQHLGSHPPLGTSFPSLGAGVLCLMNFVLAYFILPESLPKEKRSGAANTLGHTDAHGVYVAGEEKRNRFAKIFSQFQKPVVGSLMWVFFLSGLAMSQMESMLFNYMADRFQWTMRTASLGFAYIGVIMVITQGYFIRKWIPRFGERFLLITGVGFFGLSLFGIALSTSVMMMAVAMTVLAVSNGVMRPPNLGLISRLSDEKDQGLVMGVTNSLASLGRIIGPILGGFLYQHFGPASPFITAGVWCCLALWILAKRYQVLFPGHTASQSDVS